MSEVVKVQSLLLGDLHRLSPFRVEGRPAKTFGERTGEHGRTRIGPRVSVEMNPQGVGDSSGECDSAYPSGCLGRCHESVAVLEFDDLLLHSDGGLGKVYVVAAQAEQLAKAQSPKTCQKDQGAIPLVDR
ncbi:MAG TPA: hypothetical protein VNF71_12550 [Acidimicrobiales bacterium]|nr:hypothetical protein [Acidimicrobiales bacterium]